MDVPSAARPLVAVGAVSLVAFASLRLYSWRAAKEPPKLAMSRIRLALGVGLPLTGLLAVFVALVTDALALTETAIRTVSPALAESPVGGVLTWVPTLVGVAVAVVAGYLGTFPYVRKIRDVDVSARAAVARFARWFAVFFGLLVVTAGTLVSLPTDVLTATLPMVGFVAGVGALALAFQPTLLAAARPTRRPTDDERERIDRLSERVGLSVRATTVVEMGGDRTASAILAGLPGRRQLFVTDHLIAEFDDDAVSGVLASKTGLAKRYYREYKFAVVLAGFGLAVGRASGDVSALAELGALEFLALLLGVMAVLAWFGKRFVFAADDYAVSRVGAATLVETLEAVADEHRVSYESGRLRSLVLMRPPLGDRLDRLWGRGGE